MAIFNSNNKDVLKCLHRLKEQVLLVGGHLHEKLEVREESGDLRVYSSLDVNDHKSTLVDLPESALIPYQSGFIGIRNDEFYLKDSISNTPLTAQRRKLIEIMLEIYNLTGKIEHLRSSFVYFACGDNEELFRRLTAARSTNLPSFETMRHKKTPEEIESFLCDRFFQSRLLLFASGPNRQPFSVLMPFIDFANHHPDAEGYIASPGRLGLLNSRVVRGSNECFAQYGWYDAYDIFLNYGYAEPQTRFVRSVPLTVRFEGLGEVSVGARIARIKGRKLSSGVKKLNRYLPMIKRTALGQLAAGFLIIPGVAAPFALRQVLAIVINELGAPADLKRRRELIEHAENQILVKNVEFYRSLHSYLATWQGGPAKQICNVATAVVERQLALLKAYADRMPSLSMAESP